MKATPAQLEKRKLMRKLVEELGELAWDAHPTVKPHAIFEHPNVRVSNEQSYDEFFVIEKAINSLPAKQTEGKAVLRFRRRIFLRGNIRSLWHVWEPQYVATKPEAVDELLPFVKAVVLDLRNRLSTLRH